jgi:hypothetical protein
MKKTLPKKVAAKSKAIKATITANGKNTGRFGIIKVSDDHFLPHLCSVSAFAKMVGLKRQSIYYHIHISKLIAPVFVGRDKDIYIDWNKYRNFDFRTYPRTKK